MSDLNPAIGIVLQQSGVPAKRLESGHIAKVLEAGHWLEP